MSSSAYLNITWLVGAGLAFVAPRTHDLVAVSLALLSGVWLGAAQVALSKRDRMCRDANTRHP